jgi:hypothetical protein
VAAVPIGPHWTPPHHTNNKICTHLYYYSPPLYQMRYQGSRDSSVGIATSYGLYDRGVGVRVPVGSRFFLFSMSSRPALGPTQATYPMDTGGFFPGVKRPGREDHHSPPTSAEVIKMWIYTSTLPYTFLA